MWMLSNLSPWQTGHEAGTHTHTPELPLYTLHSTLNEYELCECPWWRASAKREMYTHLHHTKWQRKTMKTSKDMKIQRTKWQRWRVLAGASHHRVWIISIGIATTSMMPFKSTTGAHIPHGLAKYKCDSFISIRNIKYPIYVYYVY